MSRDIYIQDIPADALSPSDIPEDFLPRPLPFDADHVRSVITRFWPTAVFHAGSGTIEGSGIDIETQIEDSQPFESFALFDRSSDRAAANRLITAILSDLQVRAFDMDQENGMLRPTPGI